MKEKTRKRIEKIKDVGKNVKKEIKEEVFFNVPNSITLLRLVLVFVFVYMLFKDYSKLSLVTVFGMAAITDWFDGFFARKLKQTTKTGARMDQVIDRIFTMIVFGSLIFYYFLNSNENNSVMLLFLIISREIIGLPGFLIILIRGKDPYKVRYIGKAVCWFQGFALGAVIINVSWAIYLVVPTCLIGIVSGIDYLRYSIE